MKPRLHSSPALHAITVVLTIIHFPSIWCQETLPYDICGQVFPCGDFQMEYPFWGFGRPKYCGHPSFKLTCRSNVPELRLDFVDYRVLYSNSSTHIMTVARNDLASDVCPLYLYNTTYNSMFFNGTDLDQDVYLYYGCVTNVVLRNTYGLPCDVNGTKTDSYFFKPEMDSDVSYFTEHCKSHITVPVDRFTNISSLKELRDVLMIGFNLQWMANNEDCDRCIQSNGLCGSNSTLPELFACFESRGAGSTHSSSNGTHSLSNGTHFMPNGTHSLSNGTHILSNGTHSSSSGTTRKVIIGISCAITVIMFLLFVSLCKKKWLHVAPKGTEAAKDKIEIFIRNYGSLAPKRYKYSEIKKMTNSFLEKLGQGGYGSVYRGQLPDGHQVAVKLLSKVIGDGEDFINEVASISRTSHVNVVTLIGFCFERKQRALLYEYMPNGSLDRFLHGDGFHLEWNTLFQIAKGIARGLEYLHRGCNTRIVHFDIKPHNILLDEDFVPKISDFGLAKFCKKKESIVSITGARGTVGYIAPEVIFKSLGGASHKSDVYSYGMMVLEMTGACRHNNARRTSTSEEYFPDWIYKQVEVGGNLGDNIGVTTEEEDELARKMMMVSLWCIQSDPSDRPSISKVVEMLEGSFESLQVPPRRFESSPARPFQGTPPSSTQSSSGQQVSKMQRKISLPNSKKSLSELV